jgi:hypothetical protein
MNGGYTRFDQSGQRSDDMVSQVSQKDFMDSMFNQAVTDGKLVQNAKGAFEPDDGLRKFFVEELAQAIHHGLVQRNKGSKDINDCRKYAASAVDCRFKRGRTWNGNTSYYKDLEERAKVDPSVKNGPIASKAIGKIEATLASIESPEVLQALGSPEMVAQFRAKLETDLVALKAEVGKTKEKVNTPLAMAKKFLEENTQGTRH